jgi:DNA invertase Pin-like site-specific DNA recombinase
MEESDKMSKKHSPKTPEQKFTGQKIGYARVSTIDQNLNLQLDALKSAGCYTIYEETASGKNSERPELNNCLKALHPGDVLVVWKLDRLGRSLHDLIIIVNSLSERGIGFQSLTENLETTSITGELIFHFFAVLADYERKLIKERTMAGLEAAKKIGRCGGRPKKIDDTKLANVKQMVNAGMSKKDIAEMLGISKSTLYTYLQNC